MRKTERKKKGEERRTREGSEGSDGGWRADRLLDLVVKWQLSLCAHQQMRLKHVTESKKEEKKKHKKRKDVSTGQGRGREGRRQGRVSEGLVV